MRISYSFPSSNTLEQYRQLLGGLDFSYPEQGATQGEFPRGYDHDRNRCLIGRGEEAFDTAKLLLKRWQHFPHSWTKIYDANEGPVIGREVVVLFFLFGLWWKNGARVLYLRDEPRFFGFAYGTLPGHIEQGEEIFYVEMDENREVYYGIQAFSKPAWWPVRIGYPVARFFQRRFVKDSMAQMQKLTRQVHAK